MFAAILAALENPAVDAALVGAVQAFVVWIRSLPEQDRQKAIDLVRALAKAERDQLAAFDADLVTTRAHLDSLQAAADAKDHSTVTALVTQLKDRFSTPLPTPSTP